MTNSPNILLVVLDTVRARNTSLHGYERKTTPFLEEFKEESTWYTQARSPGTHSMASHVSMFTNYHVEQHNAVEYTNNINIDETIWRNLANKYEYSTGLFSSNSIISESSNLKDAFDTQESTRYNPLVNKTPILFEDAYDPRHTQGLSKKHHIQQSIQNDQAMKSFINCGYLFSHNKIKSIFDLISEDYKLISGERYVEEFLEWENKTTNPWAACMNLMDAHGPFEPKEQFDKWSDSDNDSYDLYDGTILQVDQYIKHLIHELKNRSIYDDTLIIITSDHGTAFGKENNEFSNIHPEMPLNGKKTGLHEVLTHVPLLVKYPHQTTGDVVNNVASLTNIPKLIQGVLDENKEDSLINEEYVISSTFRMDEMKAKRNYGRDHDTEKWIGPWRAVYEDNDEGVRKYLVRDGYSVVVNIFDAHTNTVVDRNNEDTRNKVESVYSNMTSKDIAIGKNEISTELEDHLNDLGYFVD